MNDGGFTVLADAEALAAAAADWLIARSQDRPRERFAVALAGGTTPRRLYERLAEPPRAGLFPWERTHWFWSDERFVPPDDPRSNSRMATEAMLARAPVPAGHMHPIPTLDTSPQAAAEAYGGELAAFHGGGRLDRHRPLLDVALLGLGTDGHTASLFPGSPALAERDAWVVADTRSMPEPRITLTFPALESSRHVVFLVAGADKRAVFQRFRRGDPALPASRLRAHPGLAVFVDAAAAEGS